MVCAEGAVYTEMRNHRIAQVDSRGQQDQSNEHSPGGLPFQAASVGNCDQDKGDDPAEKEDEEYNPERDQVVLAEHPGNPAGMQLGTPS